MSCAKHRRKNSLDYSGRFSNTRERSLCSGSLVVSSPSFALHLLQCCWYTEENLKGRDRYQLVSQWSYCQLPLNSSLSSQQSQSQWLSWPSNLHTVLGVFEMKICSCFFLWFNSRAVKGGVWKVPLQHFSESWGRLDALFLKYERLGQ